MCMWFELSHGTHAKITQRTENVDVNVDFDVMFFQRYVPTENPPSLSHYLFFISHLYNIFAAIRM